MNYARIYNELMDDRKGKEPSCYSGLNYKQRQKLGAEVSGSRVEHHHILPIKMGGSDGDENLVALSCEDHIHAHIIFAKMSEAEHGGRWWHPVNMMIAGKSGGMGDIPTRLAIKAAALMRNVKPWNFNPTEYTFINYDSGDRFTGTMHAAHLKYGGNRPGWTQLVTGDKPTVDGWYLEGSKPDMRSSKGKKSSFINRDGRKFYGTQIEFCAYAKTSAAAATRVVRYQSVTKDGWRLEGVEDRQHNQPKNGTRSGPKSKVYTLRKGDDVFVGDRHQVADKLGKTVQQVSAGLYAAEKGLTSGYRGWEFVNAA